MFVKLGYEWEAQKILKGYMLCNVLTHKLFTIDSDTNSEIFEKIVKGTDVDTLLSTYDQDWEEFRKILENHNVIIYSSNKGAYRDHWCEGAKILKNSSLVKTKINLHRVFIEINNYCDCDCAFCNQNVEFPCITCHSDKINNIEITYNILDKFLFDIRPYDIQEFFLVGGNPLLSIEKMNYTIKKVKEIYTNCKIYIITNGIGLFNKMDCIYTIKEKGVIINLQYVSNDSDYMYSFNNAVNQLIKFGIDFVIQYRIKPVNKSISKAELNSTMEDILYDQNEYIITEKNLTRYPSIHLNSICNLKNLCLESKCYLSASGELKPCNGYDKSVGNVMSLNGPELIKEIENAWINTGDIKKCNTCDLQKICMSCISIKQKYENNSKLCKFSEMISKQ